MTGRRAPAIDAVVVHYSSVADLERCVARLAAMPERVVSITVVDNAAPEPVPDEVRVARRVVAVERDSNAGFAAAANQGAARGEAPLLLFANPDVLFTPGDLAGLAAALLEDEETAAVGPRLSMPDGRPQVGAAGFFPTLGAVVVQSFPLLARLPGRWTERPLFLRDDSGAAGAGGGGAARRVDWVSGAFLLVRRRAFEAVGGFDERFFMYGEDIDLCLRFHRRGWRVGYCPGTSVVHDHPTGTADPARSSARARWLDGMDRYYRLHAPRSRRLLHGIAALGFALRALAYGSGLLRPRSEPTGAGRRLAGYARRALALALTR